MRYLDLSTVLPLGSPQPDLSGQPLLEDYMAPDLWERRLELHALCQPDRDPPTADAKRFEDATQEWLQAVRHHTKQLEEEHQVEYSNWSIYSTENEGQPAILWIAYGYDIDGEEFPYTPNGVRQLLEDPTALPKLTGWTDSSTLQQEAVLQVLRQHLTIIYHLP